MQEKNGCVKNVWLQTPWLFVGKWCFDRVFIVSCSSIAKKENTYGCMTDCTYVPICTCITFLLLLLIFLSVNSESIRTLQQRVCCTCLCVRKWSNQTEQVWTKHEKPCVSRMCLCCCYRERRRCFVYCCVIFPSLRVFNVNKFLNSRTERCTSTDTFDIWLTRSFSCGSGIKTPSVPHFEQFEK